MFDENAVAGHYSHGQLVDAIRAGVRDMGHTPETITVDDLAAVDEFHIGGLRIRPTIDRILRVTGCLRAPFGPEPTPRRSAPPWRGHDVL